MNEMFFYDLMRAPGLTPSLASQIAQELGRRIVAGLYRPGDMLEDEGAIAERFAVSRSVVRDAVKILVGKGLLDVRRGIGTKVRERSSWGLLDDDVLAWHQSLPTNSDFLRQLMEIRMVIEPKAARWAAERGCKKAVDAIVVAQERMEQEKGSIEKFIIADAEFHRAILDAGNNDFLVAMEGLVFTALISSIRLTNKDPRENEESIPFHRKVCDAIVAHKPDLAERQMEILLGDAQSRLENRL